MFGGFQVGPFQPAYQQSGVSPPAPTVRIQVGGGGELTWKDHLEAVHKKKELERLLAKKEKEEERLEAKIEKAEAKAEKPEGVLNALVSNYIKVQEVRSEIQRIEFQLIAVDKFLEAMDDDEDEDLLLLS